MAASPLPGASGSCGARLHPPRRMGAGLQRMVRVNHSGRLHATARPGCANVAARLIAPADVAAGQVRAFRGIVPLPDGGDAP